MMHHCRHCDQPITRLLPSYSRLDFGSIPHHSRNLRGVQTCLLCSWHSRINRGGQLFVLLHLQQQLVQLIAAALKRLSPEPVEVEVEVEPKRLFYAKLQHVSILDDT